MRKLYSHFLELGRQSGAKGENLKSEEDALRLAERNLAREVGRMLRRKKVSLQRLNQIFSPRALSVESSRGVERGGSLRRQLSKGARAAADRTRRKLFSHSGTYRNNNCACTCVRMSLNLCAHQFYRYAHTMYRAEILDLKFSL